MSGIMVLVRDDGAVVSQAEAGAVFAALDHRGPDGRALLVDRANAVGFQRFWTTPEEIGEEQPLMDRRMGMVFVYDGRLDNRREIAEALELDSTQRDGMSDAALVFAAFIKWGDSCFSRLLGPFVVAVLDTSLGRVVCARDALGDRTLYYATRGRVAVIASEPVAILTHPEVTDGLDQTTVARFFAGLPPLPGATFFEQVRELEPGQIIRFTSARTRSRYFWTGDEIEPPTPGFWLSDRTAVEGFRAVLDNAVTCRLRTRGPSAVLMSGGLDSTSVAAIANRHTKLTSPSHQQAVIPWIFEKLPLADERQWMSLMEQELGLEMHPIVGDELWPFSNLETWPHNPNAPNETPHRHLLQRAHRTVTELGGHSLLSGDYADHLFVGGEFWLADTVDQRRFVTAARALVMECLTGHGVNPARKFSLASAFGHLVGQQRPHQRQRIWLTDHALGLITENDAVVDNRRQRASASLLDPGNAFNIGLEARSSDMAQVDLRRPFRDRRLVELALTMPAHFAYRDVWVKWLLRQAMKGDLPEDVRRRRAVSSLAPLVRRGLMEKEQATVTRLLNNKHAAWPQFVDPSWIEHALPTAFERDDIVPVVIWQCLCFELWLERRVG